MTKLDDYSEKAYKTPSFFDILDSEGVGDVLAFHSLEISEEDFRETYLSQNDYVKKGKRYIYNTYAVKFTALKVKLAKESGLLGLTSFNNISLYYNKEGEPKVKKNTLTR